MTEDKLGALLAAALPEQGPALQGPTILAKARVRTRRRRQLSVAASVVVVVLVAVLVPKGGAPRPAPVDRPNLPGGPPVSLRTDRPLPDDALMQLNVGGFGGPGRPSPTLPQLGTRVYQDGTVLGSEGTVQGRLTPEELKHLRDLLKESGLDQGGRDYGLPTNQGGGYTFQVADAPPSTVAIGATVNGVPSSDAGLTPDQQSARRAVAQAVSLIGGAVTSGTHAVTTQWSRYAEKMPELRQSMPQDVAAYRQWKGDALDQGTLVQPETYCVVTHDPKTDAGLPDTTYFVSTRVGDMPWYISYTPVLRGEAGCSLTPYN